MSAPHPDAEQLTLAALPAEQADPEVAAHLMDCTQCRAEVDQLRRTVDLARADGVGEPLPIPPTRVWQAILERQSSRRTPRPLPAHRTAAGTAPAVRPVVDDPEGARPAGDGAVRGAGTAPHRLRAPWWRRSLVGVAAAAVVGLGLGVGIGVGVGGSGDEPGPAPVVQLGPVGIADPAATGTAAMVDHDGDQRMVVELRGVTNLAGGDYLEAGLMDSSGSRLLPLGALARHGEEFRGEFTIPAGVRRRVQPGGRVGGAVRRRPRPLHGQPAARRPRLTDHRTSGVRRSRNAAMPSWPSASATDSAIASASASSCSPRSRSGPARSSCSSNPARGPGRRRAVAPVPVASAATSSSATTAATSPARALRPRRSPGP